jgi:hypothetical protein
VTEPQTKVAELLRMHGDFCEHTSPLYGELLLRSAADVEQGGSVWRVLHPHASDPELSALALRFMAAVHRLVLEGKAPELAPFYPSVGGSQPPAEAWPAFVSTLEAHPDEVIACAARPCQTNEVGRSAALLLGFLEVARWRALPFRLLELGASAGLNLRWDRYRYEADAGAWGDPASPVVLKDRYDGSPPLTGVASVAERRGCDPNPLDPASPEDRLSLTASVWADQLERLELLRAALEVARSVPATVDRASAGGWLETMLVEPATGVVTTVFHSVVLQYLSDDERTHVHDLIHAAGARATDEAPLAWLRLEPGDWLAETPHELWLTTWPDGVERKLARSGPHGRPITWLEPPVSRSNGSR